MALNIDLIERTYRHIATHLESWNQDSWVENSACGTTYCFAGWALVLNGHTLQPSPPRPPYGATDDVIAGEVPPNQFYAVSALAEEELGLTAEQADDLFWLTGTDFEDLTAAIASILGYVPPVETAAA